MTPIRKLYSPDPFDNFIKSKLEEVEVDTSLSEKYWKEIEAPAGKNPSGKGLTFLYWFSASVFIIILFTFLISKEATKEAEENHVTAKNKPSKIQRISPDNTSPKSVALIATKSKNISEPSSINPESKRVLEFKEPAVNKDLISNSTPDVTIADNVIQHQQKPADSLAGNNFIQTDVGKLTDSLKKKDETPVKKPESKRNAPYIIW